MASGQWRVLSAALTVSIPITDAVAERWLQRTGHDLKSLHDALDAGTPRQGFSLTDLTVAAAIDIRYEKRSGRNVLARVVAGGRYDLFIAVVAVGIALVAGTAIGSVSGFIGGTFDTFVMRLIDMILAFPSFVLALVFVDWLGPDRVALRA